MDAAVSFAQFAAGLKYEDLPQELIERLENDILDTLGNMLAGSAEPLIQKLVPLYQETNGGKASVPGYGLMLPAEEAAFLNAVMAFSLDYDDINEPSRLHYGCAAVPTAFAMAEELGNVSGKQLITALAAALEIGSRLGKHMIRRNPTQVMGGWDYAALFGYLTTAIIAGKLMGFDAEQMQNAMGIAFHQCAGTSVSAMDHADTKILGPAFAARAGIQSAKLARIGVTGAYHLFDSTEISMDRQYHNGHDGHLSDDLGVRWDALELGFKAYPCCRLIHRHTDAAIALHRDHTIDWKAIREIRLTSCPMIRPMCEPNENNCTPPTKLVAQFSVPWTVACALVRGKVAIDEFEQDALQDEAIRATAGKITYSVDDSLNDLDDPARVEVITENETYVEYTGQPIGSHENPIARAALIEKFEDCAAHAKEAVDAKCYEAFVFSLADAATVVLPET